MAKEWLLTNDESWLIAYLMQRGLDDPSGLTKQQRKLAEVLINDFAVASVGHKIVKV